MRGEMLAADNRPRGPRGVTYRTAWGFKGATPAFLAEVLSNAPRPVVHVCSGASRLGDVRVDLVHPSADVRADARWLPFREVGTVLMDPPWGLPLNERALFCNEALRVVRPGGWIVLYAPWMARYTTSARLLGAWVRVDGWLDFPGAPVLLAVWEKVAVRGADPRKRARELERRGKPLPLAAPRGPRQSQISRGEA